MRLELRKAARLGPVVTLAVAITAGMALPAGALAGHREASSTGIVRLSKGCRGTSAEVEQAADPKIGYVFQDWIGCTSPSGIAFSRSTNGGVSYGAPSPLPGSVRVFSWDPALAVAADGTVYASFMIQQDKRAFPVVDVSIDHGHSFVREARLVPARSGNWGDRVFVAAGRHGTVYATWDYGPSAAKVKFLCPPSGSCSFSNGDLNVVVQKSTNWGRTWGPIVHIGPGFPAGGGDEAPLVVEPDGRVDVVYQDLSVTNPSTLKLGPGHLYFTSSTDGGTSWAPRVRLGPGVGSESVQEWWIDGAIGLDAAGNLYATWDTQGSQDIGWLVYSTDHGVTWSKPLRVTPDHDSAVHIVQVAGSVAGVADVGWLSDSSSHGYALYVRPFSIKSGWLAPTSRASAGLYGHQRVWPGDTFGISYLGQVGTPSVQRVSVSWGSATFPSSNRDDIFARTLRLPG